MRIFIPEIGKDEDEIDIILGIPGQALVDFVHCIRDICIAPDVCVGRIRVKIVNGLVQLGLQSIIDFSHITRLTHFRKRAERNDVHVVTIRQGGEE